MTAVDAVPLSRADSLRRLVRGARTATLATVEAGSGGPYASLVNVASDVAGRPLLLLSRLAWHTRNLEADGRAALLVQAGGEHPDALMGERATVMGTAARVAGEGFLERYIAHHPPAAAYAGFADFSLWRLEPERLHVVAGFGRIETLDAGPVLTPAAVADEFAAGEAGAVAHMNDDHADAVALYARRAGFEEGAWRMAACDPDGIVLSDGTQVRRLDFDAPLSRFRDLRSQLAALASRARER